MDDVEVRSRIRKLHDAGEVPCDNTSGEVWAGRGNGERCVLCVEPIASTETEFEVELSSGRIFRVHRRCYNLWLEECGSLAHRS